MLILRLGRLRLASLEQHLDMQMIGAWQLYDRKHVTFITSDPSFPDGHRHWFYNRQTDVYVGQPEGVLQPHFWYCMPSALYPPTGEHDHNPVQHRDGRRPWCNHCGRDAEGVMRMGTPMEKGRHL